MKEFISPNDQALFGIDDSQTIQNAIAAALADGCRKVVIPRYNLRTGKTEWRIPVSIKMPSNFTLILDNCYMVQESGCYDNMFTNENAGKPNSTMEDEQYGITILGVGNVCLSGGEHNGLMEVTSAHYGMPRVWKNTMFLWHNVRDLRVENLHMEHQRWWAMTHLYCRNVKLKNLDFFAVPHVPNMDGIDLRVGCHDFEIENITGRTGDDTIAMTALSMSYEQSCAVEGKDSHIHDVKIRNVVSDPNEMLNVRLLTQDGNQVRDINIDTILDTSDISMKVKARAAIGIGSPGNVYKTLSHSHPDDTRNIYAKNLYTRGTQAVRFDEACAHALFENVKTFANNVVGTSTLALGCVLTNVVFDHFYYSSNRVVHRSGLSLYKEGFIPSIVRLPKTRGDLTFRHLHVDGLDCLCELGDELKLTFEDCSIENIDQLCENKGKATVIINGKELTND